MADGDLITLDYQVEYNGVLFGSIADGAAAELVSFDMFSSPDVRSSDIAIPLADGMFAGDDYYGGKGMVMELEVWGASDAAYAANLKAVLDATSIQRSVELPLITQVPEWGGNDKVRILARPRRRQGPVITLSNTVGRVAKIKVEFFSAVPRIESLTATTLTANTNSAQGGLTFDATPDFTFGTVGDDGAIFITPGGSTEVWPDMVINGRVIGPSIFWTDGTDSKTLDFSGRTVPSVSTLNIYSEPQRRSVLINDNNSRYFWLTDPTQWFSLTPGVVNTTVFRGTPDGLTTPSLDVTYRDAWA